MTKAAQRKNTAGQPRTVARHGRLKRRQPFSTVFGLVATAMVVAVVSVGSVGAIAASTLKSNIDTIKLSPADEGTAKKQDINAIKGGANILLIGSDSRVGQAAEK